MPFITTHNVSNLILKTIVRGRNRAYWNIVPPGHWHSIFTL